MNILKRNRIILFRKLAKKKNYYLPITTCLSILSIAVHRIPKFP